MDKDPDEFKYPGERWMPLLAGLALLFNVFVIMPGAPVLAISANATIAFLCILVQLEYEWRRGVLS